MFICLFGLFVSPTGRTVGLGRIANGLRRWRVLRQGYRYSLLGGWNIQFLGATWLGC